MKDQQNTLPQPLLIELQSTAAHLVEVLAGINELNFNNTPFEGKWSAAENTEHLRLSLSGSIQILKGPATATNRAPDQNVNAIRNLFLDFNAKYPSAPSLIPEPKRYDKAILIPEVATAFDQLIQISAQLDLTDTCTSFDFTGIGQLTRLEWVCVALYHAQRHIHQLELIAKELLN
ncbi:DinB family protein [Mucilaginibacter flavus]|uniref:DinB family protein n=1 Tax=Mucilaginibacter flavus TaxID=931504 RepID=UPI0025B357BF|nr:DinB family protein [Mucilaginibacter flavus]MDN3583600.1 DinB family protein [Mucilaginibacter flavus]